MRLRYLLFFLLLAYDVSVPASPRLLSYVPLPTPNLPPLPFRHAIVSNGTLYVSSYPTATPLRTPRIRWPSTCATPAGRY